MFDMVVEVLSKPAGQRRRKDLVDLCDYFTTLEFFKILEKENGQESLIDCFKVMKIEVKEKDESVFRYGDFGDQFYIILKGSANVKIPKQTTLKCTYDEYINFMVQHFDDLAFNKMNLEEQILFDLNKRKQAKAQPNQKILVDEDIKEFIVWKTEDFMKYKSGQSFGELALMNNKPRAATIICLETCYFATLDREGYKRILGKAHK